MFVLKLSPRPQIHTHEFNIAAFDVLQGNIWLNLLCMQDFATRSLTISEETPEVAMELLSEDAEVFFVIWHLVLPTAFTITLCSRCLLLFHSWIIG